MRKERKFDAASEVYAHAVDVIERNGGQHSPEYAKLVLGMGLLDFETGNYNGAIEKDSIAVKLEKTFYGVNDRQRAKAENNLGVALMVTGRLAKAEPWLSDAVRLCTLPGAALDADVLDAITNLSTLELKMGALDAAEQEARRALVLAAQNWRRVRFGPGEYS